ncbi:hypothetical protein MPER_07669 [Moniliophthora perniciosa FA553]|nr:hypothetical protein MPER_07669 [Moniliophthora perniciosa FA553]
MCVISSLFNQWCLNQNLPICAGASLGDTDPDTATGKEGDVEARCFRWRKRDFMLTLARAVELGGRPGQIEETSSNSFHCVPNVIRTTTQHIVIIFLFLKADNLEV